MKQERSTQWLAALAVLAASACAADGSDPSVAQGDPQKAAAEDPSAEASDRSTVVAHVDLDRGFVDFVELEPGAMVVYAQTKSREENPVFQFDNRKTSYPELYESLTGEPAPAALVAAWERTGRDVAPYVADAAGGDDAISETSAALTGSQFRDNYCYSNGLCRTNQTGNNEWALGRGYGMSGWFNMVDDPAHPNSWLTLDLRRKKVRKYTTDRSYTVHQGDFGMFDSVAQLTIKREWHLRTRDVDLGEVYHFWAQAS